jgi:mannonate dehydratase
MLVHSWRWFGLGDRISLEQIVQTGASGIVTALHDVPAGMAWSVVESIPVHEDIKKRSERYRVMKILIKEDIRKNAGTVNKFFLNLLINLPIKIT